jgi:hypothetical protein
LTHLKSSRINTSNEKTKIIVYAALINQIKVFGTTYQGGNNWVNNRHVLAKYIAIINISEHNTILSKEDTFIDLTLNEVVSNESFT